MKDNYIRTMEKFRKYVEIVVEGSFWKRPDTITLELNFINDIDKVAQKYGYTAITFGENEDKRIIKFEKIK